MSRCEYVATLQALGESVPPAELFLGLFEDPRGLTPLFDFNHKLWALSLAGRLGDFVSICVYAPAPTMDGSPPSPLDLADDQFLPPLYVGFGQKAAAIEIDPFRPMTVPMTEIASGESLDLVGNHAKVFFAPFTHNTYPAGGRRPRASDPTRETICEYVGVGAGDEPPINKKKRRRQMGVACLMKVLALGPGIGWIACVTEANRDVAAGEPFSSLPEELFDDPPREENARLILTPAGQVDAFTPAESTTPIVRAWAGTPEQRVLDPTFASPRLSWGPPALMDPFRRRQGEPMPQFLGPFIGALGRYLEEN